MMTSNQIRETFLDFFRSKQHAIVPSAPMVVKGDPTLMFTNAGMNQFKDVILGNAPVTAARAADSQKCLRVSGKHNDLEEVGHDTYHHTMFEMLGNWSFGDYFKREAIEWAWELLTGVFKLPAEQIYVTVFEGDSADGVAFDAEAWELWRAFVPEDHIIRGNKKDNFWEMGDTGPCGPCSEIHFDNRSAEERAAVSGAELVNSDNPLVIEIWNLVFMQYMRRADGSLVPLAMRCIDTGMGFERLCMIIQGVRSNYDTDVFQPTIQRLAAMCGRVYGASAADGLAAATREGDVAMRVIADHLRAIAFSIADGQLPSNVKAGYVIRRVLRRAVRYGYTYLGFTEPFMWKLVDGLAAQMGGQYPELAAQKQLVEKVIQEEEASFLRTLATGISLLDGVIARAKAAAPGGSGGSGSSAGAGVAAGAAHIGGTDAFQLYDTFGFPIDLTELIARENGLTVDLAGFEKELAAQKERSRGAATVENGDWVELMPLKESEFTGYDSLSETVRVARWREVTAKGRKTYQLVFDRTPFYGASGGQTGDTGVLEHGSERVEILDTLKENGQTVHIVAQLPSVLSASFTATVDASARGRSAANHSATHLLHEALREILGTHVEQKGSLVSPSGLRFDFSHFQKVTSEELREVERRVNKAVRANHKLDEDRACTIEAAKEKGAMMLFGEKYGDRVRVVGFGSSVELCGGTHVAATGDIGFFRIVSEAAIAAGVRRVEAVTGAEAENLTYKADDTLKAIQETVGNPRVGEAVQKLFDANKSLEKELAALQQEKLEKMAAEIVAEIAEGGGSTEHEKDVVVVRRRFDMKPELVRNLMTMIRPRVPGAAMVAGIEHEGKPTLAIMLGDEVVARGLNAGAIVKQAASEIEGSGGGQPFFAMAGGKNPAGLERAIDKAIEAITNLELENN
ncbi:MAG: alanine--tRNA ligase [Alistipes sp.]|jgi:alanyl-tRNA synthetase|nr:alanine--tRNA ligase [Alistipes sp.]